MAYGVIIKELLRGTVQMSKDTPTFYEVFDFFSSIEGMNRAELYTRTSKVRALKTDKPDTSKRDKDRRHDDQQPHSYMMSAIPSQTR